MRRAFFKTAGRDIYVTNEFGEVIFRFVMDGKRPNRKLKKTISKWLKVFGMSPTTDSIARMPWLAT